MTQEALRTGMCVWGIEIPTITIFQIQRLLVSEQRNNKFNRRWSLKEKERVWVLESIPPPRRKYLHLLCQYPGLENLQADRGAQFGLFWTGLMPVGTHTKLAHSLAGTLDCLLCRPGNTVSDCRRCSQTVSWCTPFNATLLSQHCKTMSANKLLHTDKWALSAKQLFPIVVTLFLLFPLLLLCCFCFF